MKSTKSWAPAEVPAAKHTVQSYITHVSLNYRVFFLFGRNWRKYFRPACDRNHPWGDYVDFQRVQKRSSRSLLDAHNFPTLRVHKAYFRYRARPEESHRPTSATGHTNMTSLPHTGSTINRTKPVAQHDHRHRCCKRG